MAKALVQQTSLKDQIVGAWTYVAVDIVHPDGNRVPLYGPSPQDIASSDGSSH